MELRGRVIRERVGAGTKSEHNAFLLVTADGRRLQLRVRGGNPFYDPSFEALLGQEIVVEGRIVGVSAILDALPRSPGNPRSQR